MFEYPIPIPRDTAYDRFGIGPEALPEEVREAKMALIASIGKQKSQSEKELNSIYDGVPGLRESLQKVKNLQSDTESDNSHEIQSERKKLAGLERKAQEKNINFRQLQRRISEYDQELEDINRKSLEKPERRREYDESHPPLALLKLGTCVENEFAENRTAFYLLRCEVSEFLRKNGEEVFHPSDFTRTDFSSDFTLNSLLDGDKHE